MKKGKIGSYLSFFEVVLLFLFSGIFVPFANSLSDFGFTGPDSIFLVTVTQSIQLATDFVAFAIAFIACFFGFLLSLKCSKNDFKLKEATIYLLFTSILAFLAGIAYLIPNACFYNAWGCLFNLIGLLIGVVLLAESLLLIILTIYLGRKAKDSETKTIDVVA